MIQYKHVSYRYPNAENNVIQDLNLSIKQGEWLALLGHNGSGKSTLAKLTNGLLSPTVGEIIVDGLTLNDENLWKVRQSVGMVFQNPENQFVGTTVIDDVAFGLENLGVPRDEMVKRIKQSLELVEMAGYEMHEPHKLSGGQKQRIAIAGILAMMPKIIIFDEATTMLDPSGRKELLETIKQIRSQEEKTVVSITHDLNEAVWADRVVVLNQGQIWFDGTPKTLLAKSEQLEGIGLHPPLITRLTRELRLRGLELEQPLHYKELVNQIWRLHSKR